MNSTSQVKFSSRTCMHISCTKPGGKKSLNIYYNVQTGILSTENQMDDGMTHDNMKTGFDISIRRPPSMEIFTAEPMFEFFIPGIILGNRALFSHPSHNPWLQGTIAMATANHLECGPVGCGCEFLNGLWWLPGETEPWAQQGYFTLDVILGESFIGDSLKEYVGENVQSGGHYQIWCSDQDFETWSRAVLYHPRVLYFVTMAAWLYFVQLISYLIRKIYISLAVIILNM